MRVTRAKADENRRTVIDVASRLFRERGFDGIGLNDLMKGAGLTHGGFYKQFRSKEDLAVQASAKALQNSTVKWTDIIARATRRPLDALVRFYLSDAHRRQTAEGCAFAALGSEAARHGPALREAFETSVNTHLDMLDGLVSPSSGEDVRDRSIVTLSTMVGALILSRAVNDERLSKRILQAAANSVLVESPDRDAAQGPLQ